MATEKKVERVNKLLRILDEYESFIITDYRGLTVEQLTNLRRELLANGAIYQVVKNNLIKIAVGNKKIEGLDEYFSGPTAIAFTNDDPINTSKILSRYVKKTKILELKGGYSNGDILSGEDVITLSKLPSREVLMGRFVGSLKGPLYGLSNVFMSLRRNLVYTLSEISQSKKK